MGLSPGLACVNCIQGNASPFDSFSNSYAFAGWRAQLNLTFALPGHFRRWSLKILFAFNGGTAETRQVKTLTLF